MAQAPYVVAIVLALSISSVRSVNAQATDEQTPLEQYLIQTEIRLLGVAPPDESIQLRLDSVETKLFGRIQTGGVLARIANIKAKLVEVTMPVEAKSETEIGSQGQPKAPTFKKAGTWPEGLPKFVALVPKTDSIKAEISSTSSPDALQEEKPKKIVPEKKTYEQANALLAKGDWVHARELFDELSEQYPENPNYFYGAGDANVHLKKYNDAWPDMVIAWHLGGPAYKAAADSVTAAITEEEDTSFHLNDYQSQDPACLLNAGVRLWKLGAVPQATKLFEYTIKHGNVAAPAAAYNLGAMFEYRGNLKAALGCYQWAQSQFAASSVGSDQYANLRMSSLMAIGGEQLRLAISDVEWKLAHASKAWDGWIPGGALKSAPVCPLCAITRTTEHRTEAARAADRVSFRQRLNQLHGH